MVTLVGCETTAGTMLKLRVLVGSSTTSCAGTGATAGLLLTILTTAPPGGASDVRSARARTALPPATVLADNVNDSVRPAWTPRRGILLSSWLSPPPSNSESCTGGVSLNA